MSTLTHPRPKVLAQASPAAIVRGFHPGWFAAVMGTGIVGVAAYLNPGNQSGLHHTAHVIGVAFVLLAWLLAIAPIASCNAAVSPERARASSSSAVSTSCCRRGSTISSASSLSVVSSACRRSRTAASPGACWNAATGSR